MSGAVGVDALCPVSCNRQWQRLWLLSVVCDVWWVVGPVVVSLQLFPAHLTSLK
jgi:hypothetical protein